MRFSDIFFSDHKKGFTLPEILLAASIIAVISALVVPTTISRYQKKTFAASAEKYRLQIQETIDALPVTENKSSFAGTSLYVDKTEVYPDFPSDEDKLAVANFLRNNFKTTKVYSDVNSEGHDYISNIEHNCLMSDRQHTEHDYYACATLRSGAVICARPQTRKENAVWVFIDLNGPDVCSTTDTQENPPNTMNVDMYEFSYHYDVAPADVVSVDPRNPEPIEP